MAWTSHVDVDKFFGTRPPVAADARAAIESIRESYQKLGHAILEKTPPSADQSMAIRLLRESYHTAIDAVVLEGLAPPSANGKPAAAGAPPAQRGKPGGAR